MGIKALLNLALGYWKDLWAIVALSLLVSLASLSIPWIGARLLGGVINVEDVDLGGVVLLLVGALGLVTGLRISNALVSSVVSTKIEADFRHDIYAHVQRLPLGFFDHNRQGDLLALLTWEVSRLSSFLAGTLTSVPAALLTGAGAMLILFAIDPLLAALVPLLLPGYYIALKVIGRQLRVLATQVQQAEAGVFASAEENLEMLPAIKAGAHENLRLKAYNQVINKARRLKVQEQKIYAVLGPALTLVTALAAILILVLAGTSLENNRIDATELFSFLFYAALLTGPVGSLANLYGQLNTARGTLERLHHVLQEAPEPGYANTARPNAEGGWVSFQDVWFGYRARKDTLQGLNLDIAAGEIVALVGENGAGKSTIVKLLMNFYQPDRGQILLNGQDISGLNVQKLRQLIGYVPQRPLLQNASVRDNLVLGRKRASKADIEHACRLAQAHDFISGLPDGYETEIGDHGVRLSGGQRQRIALARALIGNPPIVILDEATSMYDLEGEAAFVAACQEALVGRTVILITHRPASLALADRILTLQGGRIVKVSHQRSSINAGNLVRLVKSSPSRER